MSANLTGRMPLSPYNPNLKKLKKYLVCWKVGKDGEEEMYKKWFKQN